MLISRRILGHISCFRFLYYLPNDNDNQDPCVHP
jgi:hypothetical protein